MGIEVLFQTFPRDWKVMLLGEICKQSGGNIQTGPFGSQLHAEDYVVSGIPSIMPQNIGDYQIVTDDIARITSADAQRLSKYLVKPGDIVYSRRGDITRRALIQEREDGWLCGTGCLRIRPGQGILHPEFAFYYLGHPIVRNWIALHAVGATMPNLNTSILSNLPFLVPSFDEQEQIASTLTSLDRKIENLRRQNETLEQIAQTLFKHWFIDFEFPNAAGEPYKSSGGAMERSELGEIPAGWRVSRLGDEFDIAIGRTPPRKESEWFSTDSQDIKWVSIKDMGSCGTYIFETSEYLTREAVTQFNIPVIPKNTVILSFKLTVGRVAITPEEMLSNEAIAHLRTTTDSPPSEYIYLFLSQFNFDKLGSTSSIATAVNSKSIKALEIVVPSSETLSEFYAAIKPFFEKLKINSKQIQTLTQTRDVLLPKLMSGKLRIKP